MLIRLQGVHPVPCTRFADFLFHSICLSLASHGADSHPLDSSNSSNSGPSVHCVHTLLPPGSALIWRPSLLRKPPPRRYRIRQWQAVFIQLQWLRIGHGDVLQLVHCEQLVRLLHLIVTCLQNWFLHILVLKCTASVRWFWVRLFSALWKFIVYSFKVQKMLSKRTWNPVSTLNKTQ